MQCMAGWTDTWMAWMDGWIPRRVRASDGCREEGEGREACRGVTAARSRTGLVVVVVVLLL